MYSVQMEDNDTVYLILMGNSKKCQKQYIKKIYDLKGSLVKRIVKGDESTFKNTAVLKDRNLQHLKREERCLLFHNDDTKRIMRQMGLDISLLAHFNLMDYSLLFVIEYNPAYVKRYPHEFQHDDDGELVFPVRPTKKQEELMSNKNIAFDSVAKKKKISDEFMAKMAG